jgi:hypothetical protein
MTNPNYITLIASLTTTLPRLKNIDDEEIEGLLISNGYTFFWMRGALIDQLAELGESADVEDLHYFFNSYDSLEKLIMIDQPFEHYGGIVPEGLKATAYSDRQTVTVTMDYRVQYPVPICKNLTFTLPETEYVQWWRSLAHQIVECSKTPHPGNSQVNA